MTQLTGGLDARSEGTNRSRFAPPPLHLVEPQAKHRRTLVGGVAYWFAASVIGLGLLASLTPTPLYRAYSLPWHFSPLTLTLIFATYAFGVLASLLLVRRCVR